jgi:hypothetical protein
MKRHYTVKLQVSVSAAGKTFTISHQWPLAVFPALRGASSAGRPATSEAPVPGNVDGSDNPPPYPGSKQTTVSNEESPKHDKTGRDSGYSIV